LSSSPQPYFHPDRTVQGADSHRAFPRLPMAHPVTGGQQYPRSRTKGDVGYVSQTSTKLGEQLNRLGRSRPSPGAAAASASSATAASALGATARTRPSPTRGGTHRSRRSA